MSFLKAVFDIDEETSQSLVRCGVVSSYWFYHWEIYQHWLEMIEVYGHKKAATDDACLHYQIDRSTLYRIVQKFRKLRV